MNDYRVDSELVGRPGLELGTKGFSRALPPAGQKLRPAVQYLDRSRITQDCARVEALYWRCSSIY